MDTLDAHDLLRLADQRGGARISIFLPPTAAGLKPSATASG